MTQALTILAEHWDVLLLLCAVVYIVYGAIDKLKKRTSRAASALKLTKRFYHEVDILLGSERLPEQIKSLLYDMLILNTFDEVGSSIVQEIISAPLDVDKRVESPLMRALEDLSANDPDLAKKVVQTMAVGMTSMFLAHGGDKLEAILAQTVEPIRVAEVVDQKATKWLSTANGLNFAALRAA